MNTTKGSWQSSIIAILIGIIAALLFIVFIKNEIPVSDNLENTNASKQNEIFSYQSFNTAVAKSAPAVVNIYTRNVVLRNSHPLFQDPIARQFFGLTETPSEKVQTGLGSGVIMNSEGFILTNHHVVKGADQILVQLSDKREAQAQVIGIDSETDLAVLKITLDNLPYIQGINAHAKVGDIVLAIGNPLGIGQTVTQGIVSATGRSNLGLSTYENFIQTDASINKGNSGGALVDTQGHLIGINSVIFSQSGGSDGIGFAIPAPLAQEVLNSIIENGKVVRGWLGANFQKLTPELANYLQTQENYGVVIVRVLKNGPAHSAGIIPGDLVLKIDGKDILDEQDALSSIAEVTPGKVSNLLVHRKGVNLNIKVTLGERPTQNE